MKPTFVRLNRRDVLRLTSSGVGYAALARLAEGTAHASGPIGPTTIENLQPGTTGWVLNKAARGGEIEGYANLTSVNRGGSIRFHVNCQDPEFKLEVYRMGWYGGLGGRQVFGPVLVPGVRQPAAILDPDTYMIECPWPKSYTLDIPYDAGDPTVWPSGYYLAKLIAKPSGWQTYIPFVVRDDQRNSDFLMQSSVTTFQAYNTFGGKCLYDYLSPGGRSHKVSFNRPYRVQASAKLIGGCGAAEFLIGGDGGPPAGWEYNMVRFLEREGFDVSYCTNIDTHVNPNLLLGHRGFLSVGHDEYWSWEMRQNVTQARDSGVCLGFFSANSVYWQIRLEPSPITGFANRTVVCYKFSPRDYQGDSSDDPFHQDSETNNDHLITITWRGALPGSTRQPLPEEQLLGTQYEFGADRVNAAMVCTNPNHWVFAGTGLVDGSTIPGVIGYEADRMHGSQPSGTVLLARSPHNGNTIIGSSYADMTLYTANSGAFVFATGSVQWAYGLDDFNPTALRTAFAHPAAQQMTRNVLTAMTQVERTGVTAAQAKPGGPYTTLLGEPTVFDGSASHGANSDVNRFIWDFGDGSSAEGVNPSHTYAAPGSYVVKLTIVDNNGNTDDSLTSVSIRRLLWSVSADNTWDSTYQGKRFFYPASGLNDDIIPIPTPTDLFNQWLSAGGQGMDNEGTLTTPINVVGLLLRRTSVNCVRIFQSAYNQGSQFQTKDFRLWVRVSGGEWQLMGTKRLPNVSRAAFDCTFEPVSIDEIKIEILRSYDLINKAVGLSEIRVGTVDGPLSALPIIKCTNPITGKESLPIAFDASASYDPDGTIVSWVWDFGDGGSATGPSVSHTYAVDGQYLARVAVTDDDGNTRVRDLNVIVDPHRRYKTVTADSTYDVITGGKRYYYPPIGVGDFVVPNSTDNLFKQWFSRSRLPVDGRGALDAPQNVTMTFFARQTVNRMRVTQAWYTTALGFKTRGFRVYLRQTGGSWELVGNGFLQPGAGSAVDVTFDPREADEARVEIISLWDTTALRSVGLAEVEVFSGSETGNKAPIARAVAPSTVQVASPFSLDGSQSNDPDGSITAYEWSFSDGTTLTGSSVQKTVDIPGIVVGYLTVTDNAGAKSTTSFEIEARGRYLNVSATSTFDETTGGKRYYYPPTGIGDFVVPVPITNDLMRQWLSKTNLPHTGGVLTAPQVLNLNLWEPTTLSQITLRQASYVDGNGFNSKDVRVSIRTGGVWKLVGAGQLPNTKAAPLTVTFDPASTRYVMIEVLSTWDLTNKGVGLSEVEVS